MRILTSILAFAATMAAMALEPSGTLPVMYINTAGSAPIDSKTTYVDATCYIDPMSSDAAALGSADAPVALQIRGRGNWTWNGFDKKPYRVKFADKQKVLGMKKNKHFALLAHADDSYGFLRNTMGFWISRAMGMPWTPAQQPVEVVLNGDYIGLYFLTETIRVDKDRVNIVDQPDNATDADVITGGWLVELDNYRDDPHIEITEGDANHTPIIVTYKTPEALSTAQESYLIDQMSAINEELYHGDLQTAEWGDLVDFATLARFYITQEVMCNYESFHGSCYLNKDQGETTRWMFGPVWDFGSTFNGNKTNYIYDGGPWSQTWIKQMCTYPAFMEVVHSLWGEFYPSQYQDMIDYVDVFANQIAAAAARDAERWPKYGNADELGRAAIVKERLRVACNWLAERWGGPTMDSEYPTYTVTFIDNGEKPWQQVYAFSWDNNGDGTYLLFGDWPGTKMTPTTVDGKPAWTITASAVRPMSSKPGVLFGNGGAGVAEGNQTEDFSLVNGATYNRDGMLSAIADIAAPSDSPVYYNLQGVRVHRPSAPGIYIRRQGSEATKILVR